MAFPERRRQLVGYVEYREPALPSVSGKGGPSSASALRSASYIRIADAHIRRSDSFRLRADGTRRHSAHGEALRTSRTARESPLAEPTSWDPKSSEGGCE